MLDSGVRTTVRVQFARWCRTTRLDLDVTQEQLAVAVGVSRSYIAVIEAGRANPSLDLVDRIGEALGVEFGLTGRTPLVLGERHAQDSVHARCSGYAHRRLIGLGIDVAREVEIVDRRSHGWIDLLAFDPRTDTLIIIEVKTALDDIGRLERQLGWYERVAPTTPAADGWRPARMQTWLLLLASAEVDAAVIAQRDVLRVAFPQRAPDMLALLAGRPTGDPGRGLALIDPRSRRRDWLIPCRSDGRRSPLPYQDRAGAERLLSRPPR